MAAASSAAATTTPFLCIGVDGGGTKTKVVVFDARGLKQPNSNEKQSEKQKETESETEWTVETVKKRVLSEVTVGGTNQNSVGMSKAAPSYSFTSHPPLISLSSVLRRR
jgi:N-acetylglucosamine kinase-like BadF-type ATPase